jgi:hypothetical protein
VFLRRVTGRERHSWIHKLVAREMEEQSEPMMLVLKKVTTPRMQYLSALIAELTRLDESDPRVLRIIMSIQGQLLLFVRPMPSKLPAEWAAVVRDVDAAASHIADFSLAAMRAIRLEREERQRGPAVTAVR